MNKFEPEKLKITFLAGLLQRGGAERQLTYMLRVLKEAGVDLHVLSLTKNEPHEQTIREMGIPVDWVGQKRSRIARLRRIVSHLRKNPPHIFQAVHFFTSFYTGLASRLCGTKGIGSIRSNVYYEMQTTPFGWTCLKLPHFLIANSQSSRNLLLNKGIDPSKIFYLQNAVDLETFTLKDYGENNKQLQLLFLGRVSAVKRLDRFLRLIVSLREKGFNGFKAVIAGWGELSDQVKQQAAEMNLGEDILHFTGEVKDVSSIYSSSDIFISTSDVEGTPNTVIEAMAHGLPVVVTDAGGVKHLVNDECGYIVQPDDESLLLTRVIELMNNSQARQKIGKNARKYVENNHSLVSVQDKLLEIYQRILG